MKLTIQIEIDEDKLLEFIHASEKLNREDKQKRAALMNAIYLRVQERMGVKLKSKLFNILKENT